MSEFKRSPCPVANLLDIMGDKWTLLVVRDLLFGKKTYKAFQQSPEGIPSNILADRLKRLEEAGIIQRSQYQERPVRYTYHLTRKGADLGPVLGEMSRWSNKYVPGTFTQKQIASMLEKTNS